MDNMSQTKLLQKFEGGGGGGAEKFIGCQTMLPYFGKRRQVTKMTFLVKEQYVSVIFTDVNGIS